MLKLNLLFLLLLLVGATAQASKLFTNAQFTDSDAILVVDSNDRILYQWRADEPMIPASLTKLATAYLAIDKWGLDHRFHTDFLLSAGVLWVKGYGDPYVVSEELDAIVSQLRKYDLSSLKAIHVDNGYFNLTTVPGRSNVADPYNAPLSAVAANFNTVKLHKRSGVVESAEPQTPLTQTARNLAGTVTKKTERVNLVNRDNAQQHFAELLKSKLGLNLVIEINKTAPKDVALLYRHYNSHTVRDVLRGTLEYSNNFIANQTFLKLAETAQTTALTFEQASGAVNGALTRQFKWQSHNLVEGSGLSRANRLSANQMADLLRGLAPHKSLFKEVKLASSPAYVVAKTGTLNGVRSLAGYIELADHRSASIDKRKYRFVFMFNREVAYRFREKQLQQLVQQLEKIDE